MNPRLHLWQRQCLTVDLTRWATQSLLFQTVQHGSCAGLPCPARHRGDHGLRAGRQHSLGELAAHQHGSGREEHGSSPQRPWTIYILAWTLFNRYWHSTAMSTMTAFLTRYASLIFLNYDSLNKQILTMYRVAREKMFNWSMQTGWCLIIMLSFFF